MGCSDACLCETKCIEKHLRPRKVEIAEADKAMELVGTWQFSTTQQSSENFFEFLGYLSPIQNTAYNGKDLIPFSKPKFFCEKRYANCDL